MPISMILKMAPLNINPVISISNRSFLTVFDAIADAIATETIMLNSNVLTLEDNTLPNGINLLVKQNVIWTNQALLKNKGKVEIRGQAIFKD